MRFHKRSNHIHILIVISLILTISLSFICQWQITRMAVKVSINLSSPQGISQFATGASHTQDDNASYTTLGQQLLPLALTYQNVPIMGWGSDNPEPSPGSYSWESLDARVQLMRDTHAREMLTLCCAPTWMFDSSWIGNTDWNRLETAPTPDHYADFAHLAQLVALRYKDVQYFQVWNELKGFYNRALNRWSYEDYTLLYNMVYDAIKAVRPDAQIGGPYIVMDTWADSGAEGWPAQDPSLSKQPWGTIDQRSLDVLSYWLSHKHGADFLLIDAGTGTREGKWITDDFTAANVFPALINWIRKQPYGGATLPVGLAEWYPNASQSRGDVNYINAVFTHDLLVSLTSGYSYALVWGTQGDVQGLAASYATLLTNAGQPTNEYDTLKAIKDYFGPGVQFYKTTSSSSQITVLATKAKTMLVNHLGVPHLLLINSVFLLLNPYQVKIIDTPAGG
jgi:hypothetical protein